jgi:methyl-accepting chemotaxis protein
MANLETKITLSATDKASPAIKSVGQSLDRLKRSAGSIGASYSALSSAAGDFGRKMRNLSLVVAAASAGIYSIVKGYADLGETLNLTAQKTGVSVENLQKLGHAAELDKVSADDLRMSLQFLNRNMALAKGNPKSPQAKMFKSLGIDVKKTTDAYQVFMKISDKFSKSNNTAEKNLFARGLMGRGGVSLIPLLNHGSKAIRELGDEYARLGHVMSAEAAEAADNFGDNLQRLGVASKGLMAIFAEQLIPVLNPLVVQFTEWVAANKELVKTNVKEFILGAVDVFKALVEVFRTVKAVLTPLIAAFGGLGNVIKALAFVYVATLALSFMKVVYSAGMMLPALWSLVPALGAAAVAGWAFVAPLLVAAAPILGIVAAIALIGYALYQLITRFGEFKTAFLDVMSGLGDIAVAAFEKVRSTIAGMVDWIKSSYQSIKNFVGLGDDSAQNVDKAATGVKQLQTNVQLTSEQASTLGSFFAKAGAETVMAMNPVLGILMQVTGAVEKIKSALASMSAKPITIGVTTTGVPAAGAAKGASPAGAAAATPAKTALLTPPMNAAQVASAQSSRTKLDVYMKIDSEGRAKNVKAKSSGNMDFAANTGVMV